MNIHAGDIRLSIVVVLYQGVPWLYIPIRILSYWIERKPVTVDLKSEAIG